MAAFSTIAAVAGLTLAAGSALASYTQGRAAQRSQDRAEEQAAKAQAEQSAANASQAAAERRQQIRQERVRRGALLNASANTGTSGSSGEAGGLGSLSTQLGSNLGAAQGGYMRGQRIGMFNQQSADSMGTARRRQGQSSLYGQVAGVGANIFSAAGGWDNPGLNRLVFRQ